MNSKMKVFILSILVGLIVIVTGISVTYALWQSKHVGSSNNIVSSSCLDIEFKDLTNEITLNNAYPMSIEEYFDSTYSNDFYSFYITNKCDNAAGYDLNLEVLEGSDILSDQINMVITGYNIGEVDDYSYEGITNKLNSFFDGGISTEEYNNRYLFKYGNTEVDSGADLHVIYPVKLLDEYPDTAPILTNAVFSKRLNQLKIMPNETHLFSLAMFLNENVGPDEAQNKALSAKVTLNSTPIRTTKVTFDSNGGNDIVGDRYYFDDQNYGVLPIPTREDYTFLGWYYGDESNIIDDYDSLVTYSNHTLKAKWRSYFEISVLYANSFYDGFGMCNYDGSNDRCLYDTFMDIEYILPFDGNINDIDLSSAIDISEYGRPTYVWIDNNILYYHSYATDIYMQNDSFFRLLDDISQPGSSIPSLFSNVKRIDLSRMNSSMITNMDHMFQYLPSLEELNISNFDTSNVTSMNYTFAQNHNLRSLDLRSFDTSKVTSMVGMFSEIDTLESIDLSSFNTSSVRDMSRMFLFSNIASIDLSNFNTSKVVKMNEMFSDCSNLEFLDLSIFTADNLESAYFMFAGCTNLININLSGFSGKIIKDDYMLCDTSATVIGYSPSTKAYECYIEPAS